MTDMPARPRTLLFKRPVRFRGQTLVEFALVLPVMLITIFVIIELARLLYAWLAVENGARFGVRYAVTGEFDPAFCLDGPDPGTEACEGTGRFGERNDARLPSIDNAVRSGAVAILRDESVPEGLRGHFDISICSNAEVGGSAIYLYHASIPNAHLDSWCELAGSPGTEEEHPGGPGDRVSVTVDFEHPLIVPILSNLTPTIHLTARREGIVEQFRVARVVGLPATISVPTWTATVTSTPTSTPTVTDTPTITPTLCKVPPVVEIQLPLPGTNYPTTGNVESWATAYDPDNADPDDCIGIGFDGQGISEDLTGPAGAVHFHIDWLDPSAGWVMDVYSQVEPTEKFCGFGGSASCNTHPVTTGNWPGGGDLMRSGTHRFRVWAIDDEGVSSPVETVLFTIDVPPTATPTTTLTPTATPTIDCSAIDALSYYRSGNRLYMLVRNSNARTIYLTDSSTDWEELSVSEYFDRSLFNTVQYYGGNDYDSPTNAGPGSPSSFPHPPFTLTLWQADFANVPGGQIYGDYATTLTFDYICNVSANISYDPPTATPTPSDTPTPTITPTPSNTPPPTNTATATATPHCGGVGFGGTTFLSSARLTLNVINTSYPGLQVTGITINWGPLDNAADLYGWSEYLDAAFWNGSTVYGGNDYSSTTSFGLSRAVSANNTLLIDWDGMFEGYLSSPPLNLSSSNFGYSISFSDPSCNISQSSNPVSFPPPTNTPTPTNTLPPTNTPTKTSTPTKTPTATNTSIPSPTNTVPPTLPPTATDIPTSTPTATEVEFD